MKRRLLVVARRFWPLCDEDCHRLLAWATMLRENGFEVTILTGRWHASWPPESDVREIKVVRLLPAPRSSWNETLFLRNVATWISRHRNQFDMIYVDESQSLLHQITVKSVCDTLPVFARFMGATFSPQSSSISNSYQLSALSSATDACRGADKVVAPSAHAQRQLMAGGIPEANIVRIADAPWQPILRNPESRKEAAFALRNINSDLRIPSDSKLLLYIGPLDDQVIIEPFLRAAITCLELGFPFRVWIVGSGRKLSGLYDIVKQATYHHDILFCSHFDQIDELYQVADGLIHGLGGIGCGYYLPQAIASGLPTITIDQPEIRPLLPNVLHDSLVQSVSNADMQRSLTSLLSDYETWQIRAQTANLDYRLSNQLQESQRAWIRLFS